MIYSAGDLGIEIDLGRNRPGAILQRKDDGIWKEVHIGGKPAVSPIDMERLRPGHYRLMEQK